MSERKEKKEEWFIDFTSDFIIDQYYQNDLTVTEIEDITNTVVDNKELASKVFKATCSKLVRKVA